MNRLAAPPSQLSSSPQLKTLPAGTALLRFYQPRHGDWASQRHYGPLGDMRFDHHPEPLGIHPAHSVWYAATSLRGAVAESFGRLGLIDRGAGARLVKAKLEAPLQLVDLVGVAARAAGLTQEIATSTEYAVCRQWAQAFHRELPACHGLRWRGRQSGSLCVVLHDRVERDQLSGDSWPLSDAVVWPRIARAAREFALTVL
ncbi:MAG: RES family NAD+ phosphorylase [Acidobacteriota bacterium]